MQQLLRILFGDWLVDGSSEGICRNCGTEDHADFDHSAWSLGCPNPRISREEWRRIVNEKEVRP